MLFVIPNKKNCTWRGLFFFCKRSFPGSLLHARNPSSTEPGEHGYFSRLPDYQSAKCFVSMPLPRQALVTCLAYHGNFGSSEQSRICSDGFYWFAKLIPRHCPSWTAPGWRVVFFFFLIFEVRSYKMVGGIYSPNWQEKCRLYPRYSPCLRFGGYRIPITYYQNQNNPMIGEIFGEPVCDRIIWELQYLLRNYPRFLHVMGKFGSRITLWWSDMIW